jgi:hypothetical protein
MKNWKIGTRITAGFGAVLFLTVLPGIFAYSRIGDISRSSAEISGDSMPGLYRVCKMQKDTGQIMRLIRQHILADGKQEKRAINGNGAIIDLDSNSGGSDSRDRGFAAYES